MGETHEDRSRFLSEAHEMLKVILETNAGKAANNMSCRGSGGTTAAFDIAYAMAKAGYRRAPPPSAHAAEGEADKLIVWLYEASRYFEKRPTNGVDAAHWANVTNAANCLQLIHAICSLRSQVENLTKERDEARAKLDEAVKALGKVKAAVAGDKVPRWAGDWATTSSRARIADICDAVLKKPAQGDGGAK